MALLLGGCAHVELVEPVDGVAERREALAAARRMTAGDASLLVKVVDGDSMMPGLPDGSVVVLKRVPFESLRPGMTVGYENHWGRAVLHSLVRPRGSEWEVRGISNPESDRDRITRDNFLGVLYAVIYTLPKG